MSVARNALSFSRKHWPAGLLVIGTVVILVASTDSVGMALPEKTTGYILQDMLGIIAATFVSEDLACIGVGLLINAQRLDLLVGLASCWLGILAGDVGLWLLGRLLGRRVLDWTWVRQRLPANGLDRWRAWFDRRGWRAVLAARFLPGTRLPVYIAAGALGRDSRPFLVWAAVAGLLWTPLLVGGVALFGQLAAEPISRPLGTGWPAYLLTAAAALAALRLLRRLSTRRGRWQLWAGVARLWRWEFWPSWLFYLPLVPWLLYLSIRYRGMTVWTAANPGIPEGGVVGESKYAILTQLPSAWVIPSFLVALGEHSERVRYLEEMLRARQWSFPLIFKPDASQRGAGLKLIQDLHGVEEYLRAQPAAVLVQKYHPGPYEAGIFYYRIPGESSGHIFSITDKVFPEVVGDGRATLEELIWRHPRFRMQARVFLARHASSRQCVLLSGERFRLAVAGNHCQGTMFRDGSRLITAALERAVDEIARQIPGFFIGRFDVRYANREAFQAGTDLAIVELNGVTAESTNIYDPSWSVLAAYRTLYRQWALLYQIGHANRRRGVRPTALMELLGVIVSYYRRRQVNPIAD